MTGLPRWGSSPRVRGKHPLDALGARASRLIPARAGKTAASSGGWCPGAAHPRACGENFPFSPKPRTKTGSSPRVRGKQPVGRQGAAEGRLIPARAGKTCDAVRTHEALRAHPRACGENPQAEVWHEQPWGSSPRVRGKPGVQSPNFLHDRLIPARAGKTNTTTRAAPAGSAHPRACGENVRTSEPLDAYFGSSPRVRGKPPAAGAAHALGRLIPARAGKTYPTTRPLTSSPAHPRACGENVTSASTRSLSPGSSPRVRGKPTRWVRRSRR